MKTVKDLKEAIKDLPDTMQIRFQDQYHDSGDLIEIDNIYTKEVSEEIIDYADLNRNGIVIRKVLVIE